MRSFNNLQKEKQHLEEQCSQSKPCQIGKYLLSIFGESSCQQEQIGENRGRVAGEGESWGESPKARSVKFPES